MGKMMDQGPVLIITFQAQLVMVIRNTKGEVVEGDPVSIAQENNTHATKNRFGLGKSVGDQRTFYWINALTFYTYI